MNLRRENTVAVVGRINEHAFLQKDNGFPNMYLSRKINGWGSNKTNVCKQEQLMAQNHLSTNMNKNNFGGMTVNTNTIFPKNKRKKKQSVVQKCIHLEKTKKRLR